MHHRNGRRGFDGLDARSRTRRIAFSLPSTSSYAVGITAVDLPPTILLTEEFDNASLAARGWYDNAGSDIITSDFAGGGGCLRAAFALTSTQPTWNILRHLFTASPTVYLSYWVKYSSNWVGSGQTYHPHEFHFLTNLDADFDGLSDNYLTTYIEHNYQSGGIPLLAFQDNRDINTGANVFRTGGGTISGTDVVANTETRSVSGANGGVENGWTWASFAFGTAVGYYNNKQLLSPAGVAFQPSPGAGYKNNWNLVEAFFAMNSIQGGIAQSDGIVRYWFNQMLLIDRTDIIMRTGAHPTLQFHQLAIAPYIGDGSPATQNVLYDHLTVQTARPAVIVYPVRTVAVTPNPSAVNASSTVQLTATLADPQGTTLVGRVVTWGTSNASIATVNASGLVTGIGAGTATITATCELIPGTSALTVSASGGTWPNEPAGFTVITDYPCSDVLPNPSSGGALSNGWAINNGFAGGFADRVTEGTEPFSSPYSSRFVYPSGFGDGSEPANMYRSVGGVAELYIGMWWKVSNPWQYHVNATNKIFFQFLGGGGGGGQVFMHFLSDRALRFVTELNSEPLGTNYSPNVTTTPITLGVWHRIELYMKKSPSTLKWWLDGILQGNYSSVSWPAQNFDEFQLAPTWGGNVGDVKTETDYYWYDHVRLSRP